MASPIAQYVAVRHVDRSPPVFRRLCILALGLLAGCAAPPPRPVAGPAAGHALVPPAVLRIGLEYLAPEDGAAPAAEVRVSPPPERPLLATSRTVSNKAGDEPVRLVAHAERLLRRHTWTLDAGDLGQMPGPFERETLRFLDDLLAADRKSARREVRVPFFDWHSHEPTDDPMLGSEFAQQQDREQWIAEHGPALLRQPFKRLLRRLPLARDVEVAIDDIRAESVPLSTPYQEAHRGRASTRVSMRLRASDWHDPLEVAVIHRGVRFGTAQNYAKASWNLPLTEHVELSARARQPYDGGDATWRCDLRYRHSARTSFHLAVGEDLEFLSTPSVLSQFESPLDGTAGVAFFAVHVF
jgi:hypothetical protein